MGLPSPGTSVQLTPDEGTGVTQVRGEGGDTQSGYMEKGDFAFQQNFTMHWLMILKGETVLPLEAF